MVVLNQLCLKVLKFPMNYWQMIYLVNVTNVDDEESDKDIEDNQTGSEIGSDEDIV